MSNIYNNIPSERTASSSDQTLQVFNQYYQAPMELNGATLTAMQGFFESRGFDPVAADSIALVILQQATKDKINAMEIMDTLSGLSAVDISALVGEILNYNRFKTSSLGLQQNTVAADDIIRNIII